MSEILIPGGGGGISSSDVSVTKAHILRGEKTVTSDSNDEIVEGTMTVNSLLSFSCAAYSGRRVLAKWQNPKAAYGKPYSGVYIRYNTGEYSEKTAGTQIYKGAGNNTASEGQSQTYLDLPALDTTYYLSCTPYITTNIGEFLGDPLTSTIATSGQLNVTVKGTHIYTIPVGYSKMDLFAVGGGGSGANTSPGETTGGGGGGYTKTVKGIDIISGQTLSVNIGAGAGIDGMVGNKGGTSSVIRSGITLISTSGGIGIGIPTISGRGGGAGGSGGGAAGRNNGGENGLNGSGNEGGIGQHSTTRAFGESAGTLYAGGGGGGAGGAGGAGGGGAAGNGYTGGNSGSSNTGGGGGGCDRTRYSGTNYGGRGGSGVVLIRLY